MSERAVLAIDIGGTKMAAAIIRDDGQLISSEVIATPRSTDAEGLFRALEQVCHRLLEGADSGSVEAIGVGCGGPMQYPAGIVSPLNIPAWREFPLRDRLTAALGLPSRVDNDAKAMAIGERWRGAGHGSNNMLGMVVSTGVGGGVILDGRLLHGYGGNAGHIGHIVVWPEGPPCGCGGRGCVEAVASGTGLRRRLLEALATGVETRLPETATAVDIAVAARDGDRLAAELFRTAGQAVGRGVASAAAVLDLEVVVIGGSIALRAWDLLGPPLEAELRESARLDFTRGLQLARARLGDQAGLFGAAALAFATPVD